MRYDINIHVSVSYDYDDFAIAGMSHIAYYDSEDAELIVISEPSQEDIFNLWFNNLVGSYDGEILGYDVKS